MGASGAAAPAPAPPGIPTGHTTRHATWHTAWSGLGAGSLVDAHHDGVEFGFEFLLLSLDGLGLRIALLELETLRTAVLDGLLILISEVSLKLLLIEGVLHLEAVVLKAILGLDLLADSLVLGLELLGIGDHLLDLFLGETTLIVGDGDLLSLASSLVCS